MSKPKRMRLTDFIPTPPPPEGVHALDLGAHDYAVTYWDSTRARPWDTHSPHGWIILCDKLPERIALKLMSDSTHFILGNPDLIWQPLFETLLQLGDQEAHSLAITFPSSVEALEDALSDIRRFLGEYISPEPTDTQRFEILLVLRELATNAILHGNKNSFDKKAGIILTYFPKAKLRRLQMMVIDSGPGYDLPGKLRALKRESSLRERHRGLVILRAYCRRIRVQPGLTAVDYPFGD
jgi:anti-sigma regulatory factor (Ser/Thr protein kinase)